MSTFLKGLALKNYRGIGQEWQKMPAFKKFNFFIGPNNSGKSTVFKLYQPASPIAVECSEHAKTGARG